MRGTRGGTPDGVRARYAESARWTSSPSRFSSWAASPRADCATRSAKRPSAIDTLIDEIGDSGPIRDAAGEARDAVEESRAALEAFREDPNAETRQALLEAETHLNDARTKLDGVLEDAPAAIRESLGDVVDGLERIRRSIRQEFED